MECKEFKALIQNYLDKELPEEVKGMWRQHFERCSTCRTEVQIYEKCVVMLQRFLGDELPPKSLRERLKQKLGCDCFDLCFPEQPQKQGDRK